MLVVNGKHGGVHVASEKSGDKLVKADDKVSLAALKRSSIVVFSPAGTRWISEVSQYSI